jgi:hypothetical protein
MDKLFSNIQQTLNQMNQNGDKQTLLQRQQISQDKINELLEKSSQAIMCGPTCQKLKVSEELKQRYLDAETNIQTAPIKLEQSKKNYYIYTEGRPYYDNMKEEELKKKADTISQTLAENFNNEVSSANTMNTYLNTALINSENTKELLKEYLEKNQVLKLKLRERHGDILTNDRKTYYETEALERLQFWYFLFWGIYYLLVIAFLLALVLSPSNMTILRKIFLAVFFIFFPYLFHWTNQVVYKIYYWGLNRIPKNVYNNL